MATLQAFDLVGRVPLRRFSFGLDGFELYGEKRISLFRLRFGLSRTLGIIKRPQKSHLI